MYSKELFLNYLNGLNCNASEELLLLNAKSFFKETQGDPLDELHPCRQNKVAVWANSDQRNLPPPQLH